MPLTKKQISASKMLEIAKKQGNGPNSRSPGKNKKNGSYTGVTRDQDTMKTRINAHQRSGKSGTIYYRKTTNMMSAEEKYLEYCCKDNKQGQSNAKEEPGIVYLIVPPKTNKKQ